MGNYYGNVKSTCRGTGVALWKMRMAAMVTGVFLLFSVLPGATRAGYTKVEAPGPAAEKTGSDGIREVVARVNGVEITKAAVEAKMMSMFAARQDETSGGPGDPEALRKDALNKLIIQELAYQRARVEGVKVGRDELDNAIAEIKAKVGGEEQYRETLGKKRLTEDRLRKELERNLMVKHIFEKEVSDRIVISEEELKKEYENVKGEFHKPEKVVVDDVVLFLDIDDKKSIDKAADLLGKINHDRDKNPWNLPSDGTFVVRELDLSKGRQAELYAEARKLAEGQVSGVIRTADSFHIIKLKQYSPEVKAEFAQIRGFIERRVRARAQQKKMEEWEVELRKGAKIEIIDAGESNK